MALGDILAGLGEASHEHQRTLLQMDYQKKRDLANLYGQVSQDPNYPEDMRAEALKRAVTIHTLEPGKKLPKEIESMMFTVTPQQPAQQPPMQTKVGMPGSEISYQPPQPPAAPPYVTPLGPMSYAQQLERGGQKLDVEGEAKLRQIGRTTEFLKGQEGLTPAAAATMAMGHPLPPMANIPGTTPGAAITELRVDSTGTPIDPQQQYHVMRNNLGQITGAMPATVAPARPAGAMIAPDLAMQMASQGATFRDRSGKPIDVASLPPTAALSPVIGIGVPPDTYEIRSQPLTTFTGNNIVQTRPALSPIPPGQAARVPTESTVETPFQNVQTGQTELIPTRRTSTPMTPATAAPTPVPGTATKPQTSKPTTPSAPAAPPAPASAPRPPATRGRTLQGVLPAAELQRQRQFATPIKQSALQLFGDPANPGFESLETFAPLADSKLSRERIGSAAKLIINDLAAADRGGGIGAQVVGTGASLNGGDLWSALKNTTGLTNWVAKSQVNATEAALAKLNPVERRALNQIMSSYGTIVGLRSLTRGGAYRFSVESMERELPIPGVSVNDSKSYYNKLSILAEEVVNGVRNNGISTDILPEQAYYEAAAKRLTGLARGQDQQSIAPDAFKLPDGRVVRRQPDGTYR